MNRRLVGQLATWHYAPTARAADHLRREGVAAERILVTGNTVVDALLTITAQPLPLPAPIDDVGRQRTMAAIRPFNAFTMHVLQLRNAFARVRSTVNHDAVTAFRKIELLRYHSRSEQ
jgi:hypothetical protein